MVYAPAEAWNSAVKLLFCAY